MNLGRSSAFRSHSKGAARRLKIAISQCLTGDRVRWDGSDFAAGFPSGLSQTWIEFVPICPEVGIGLGVPRIPIRLVQSGGEVNAVDTTPDRNNYTSELADYVTSIAPMLEDVSGFILTERSPSCGLHGVKLYEPGTDRFRRNGTGIFAASLRSHYPNLPLADSGDLSAGSSTDLFLRRAVFHYVFVRSTADDQEGLLSSLNATSFGDALMVLVRTDTTAFIDRLRSIAFD